MRRQPTKITNIKIKVQNLTDDIKKAKASHTYYISFFSNEKEKIYKNFSDANNNDLQIQNEADKKLEGNLNNKTKTRTAKKGKVKEMLTRER